MIPQILVCEHIRWVKPLLQVNNRLISTLKAWHITSLRRIDHFDHDKDLIFVLSAGFVPTVKKFPELFEDIGPLAA